MDSLLHSNRPLKNAPQTIPQNRKGVMLLNSFYEISITLKSKPGKDTKKRKRKL
jgi:hypothetical protein